MQKQRGTPEMPMQKMGGPRRKGNVFCVVRFIEEPYLDIAEYVCLPYSWIIDVQCSDRIVRVAYPSGEPREITSERVAREEKPCREWDIYNAVVAYVTGSHRFAQSFIGHMSQPDIVSARPAYNGGKRCVGRETLNWTASSDISSDSNHESSQLFKQPHDIQHTPAHPGYPYQGAYYASKYWIEQIMRRSHAVNNNGEDKRGYPPTAVPDNSSCSSGGPSPNPPSRDLKTFEAALAHCMSQPALTVKKICKRPPTSTIVDNTKRSKREEESTAVYNESRMADQKSKKPTQSKQNQPSLGGQ